MGVKIKIWIDGMVEGVGYFPNLEEFGGWSEDCPFYKMDVGMRRAEDIADDEPTAEIHDIIDVKFTKREPIKSVNDIKFTCEDNSDDKSRSD